MNKKSKKGIEKDMNNFFSEIGTKTSKDVKKIKRIVMSKNIPLKSLRKTFCKKCLVPYKSPKIRIKQNKKIVECVKCGYVSRFNLTKLKKI